MRALRAGSTSRQARARAATLIALVAAFGVAAFGLARNTRAVGGSDSSCYGLMALSFARAEWQPTVDLPGAPWPDVARTLAPAGFVPSPVRAEAASPVCAPGFSVALAPFTWLGGRDGIFVVSPIAGALLVWFAFAFARQLAGPAAGAAAASITATMPVLLFQVVQPMNDVLVAAIWMAVLAAAALPEPSRAWVLGALTGLAVLVRPNLAPAAAVTAGWLTVVTVRRHGWTAMLARTGLAFGLAAAPFIGLLLALNAVLYGHPLQSGYGPVSELFAPRNAAINVSQYGAALWQTQLALPLIGVVALVAAPPSARDKAWLAAGVSLAIGVVYLFYRPFPEWWYLRFFLPALVAMTALACASIAWVISMRAVPSTAATVIVAALAAGVAAFHLGVARERRVADLQRLERRFRTAGEVVRDRLPGNAILVTVWESGTVRFHADRRAILWDAMAPEGLDGAIEWLGARGFDPYLLIEDWEAPAFRARFEGRSAFGDLDWPPRFEIERQVKIFRPRDRAAFHQGAQVGTEFILPR